jgi:hypothetical protein
VTPAIKSGGAPDVAPLLKANGLAFFAWAPQNISKGTTKVYFSWYNNLAT